MTPPDFRNSYVENLFLTSSIKHPSVEKFDINSVYVDPILFSENTKSEIISIKNFIDIANDYRAIIISGTDRSGKTTLSKKLQVEQLGKANPYVLINGSDIRNVDIINNIKSHITEQFEGSLYRESGFSVIIDDFDECILNDSLKEKLIRTLLDSFNRLVLVSYSSAPSVLFAQDDLPNPLLVSIETLSNDRIYDIVKKWRSLSGVDVDENDQLVVDSLKKNTIHV